MNLLTLLIVAAVLCVIGSLGMGLVAMSRNGQAAHHTSDEWMTMRVAFQAAALLLIMLTLVV